MERKLHRTAISRILRTTKINYQSKMTQLSAHPNSWRLYTPSYTTLQREPSLQETRWLHHGQKLQEEAARWLNGHAAAAALMVAEAKAAAQAAYAPLSLGGPGGALGPWSGAVSPHILQGRTVVM
jgi:hypothetical protein